MAYEDYEGDIGESGYDVVGAAAAIQQAASNRGVKLTLPLATAIAKRVAYAVPRPIVARPIYQGRRTGMTTGLPLGAINFAAATAVGTQANLAQVAQERVVARRLVLQRYNQWVPAAATPLPGCQGQQVSVLDVRVGQRSVLAGGAGIPVEAFEPKATGGGLLAGGVEVPPGITVTVQLVFNGPGALPAAESISVTGYLPSED